MADIRAIKTQYVDLGSGIAHATPGGNILEPSC